MLNSILHQIIEIVSPIIGFVGIFIIFIGVIKSTYNYIFAKKGKNETSAQVILNHHLVLGLDFLVGKDIMDTFLLKAGQTEWIDLATLVTVVSVRIILSYFLEKEIEKIEKKR